MAVDNKLKGKVSLPYYSFSKILSYNAVFNFILGARGTGKTYGAKVKGIKDAINKGHEFIYLRRYKEELTAARNTFFADVAEEFMDYDFRVNGVRGEYSHISQRDVPKKDREWYTVCYFVALSQGGQKKSVSYPKVTLIIFDEFIIMKGAIHYLPNEATLLMEFFSTVDRSKEKTRVLFLANSSSIDNPYFIEWNIDPDPSEEWHISHEGFIVAHFHDSSEFAGAVYQTRFGKFIQNTEYAKYAVGNEFADNHDMLIANKNSEAKYRFTLETEKGTFSLWLDSMTRQWYATNRRVGNEVVLTLVAENVGEGRVLLERNSKLLQQLRASFYQGRMWFDYPQTRNIFREIFVKR